MNTQEISNEDSAKIDLLAVEGDAHFDKKNYEDAIKIWEEGLSIVP